MNDNESKQFISIKEASWISILLVILMFLFSIPGFFIEIELTKKFLELFAYVFSSSLLIYVALKKHTYIQLTFAKIDLMDSLLLIPLAISLVVISEFTAGLIPINPKMAKLFTDVFSFSPIMFIMTVFCAPVFEEILCRGIILRGLLKKYTVPKSIFWSAFLFGSIHLNPWQLIAGFIVGLVCGWIFCSYKNLVPTIFIHFVVNLVSMLSQIFIPEKSHFGDNTTKLLLGNNDLYYYLVLFSCGLVFSLCVFLIHRKINTSEKILVISR